VTEAIDSSLRSEEFWKNAFKANDPLRCDYADAFRRGIVEGREEDLAWARLAIYGLTDDAIVPIVARLIGLATRFPGADFVEPLSFFVSDETTLSRMKPILIGSSLQLRTEMSVGISALQTELNFRKDHDMAEAFSRLFDLL